MSAMFNTIYYGEYSLLGLRRLLADIQIQGLMWSQAYEKSVRENIASAYLADSLITECTSCRDLENILTITRCDFLPVWEFFVSE